MRTFLIVTTLLLVWVNHSFAEDYGVLTKEDHESAGEQTKPSVTARGGFESYNEWVCFPEDNDADSFCDDSFVRDENYRGSFPHSINVEIVYKNELLKFVSANYSYSRCRALEESLHKLIRKNGPLCIYGAYIQELRREKLQGSYARASYWSLERTKTKDGNVVFE